MKISVTRVARSFVRPTEPTPFESLSLSAIDLYPGSRDDFIQSLHVFGQGHQPARVIREALSKALVPYYPLAGRFVEADRGQAEAVECSGAGAWFVEATADCTLEDVAYLDINVPVTVSENDLLPDPPPVAEPRDVPLIMMQVTEFGCGGFVVGFIFNHAVADAFGAAQFTKAVADFARGNSSPAVHPIWCRHLIPNPPKLPIDPPSEHLPVLKLPFSSFDLPMGYVNEIKSAFLEKTGRYCTTFEIATATVWQARTRAINCDDPGTPLHLIFGSNVRRLLTPKVLPLEGGYYGNCIHMVVVKATSGNIVGAELVDVVRMIQDGKKKLIDEFERWWKGELEEDPWNLPVSYEALLVTDWTNLGFSEVDYGWGKPAHVIPLVSGGFATVVLEKPLEPKRGCRLRFRCVAEEHMAAFQEHVHGLTRAV